LVFDTLKHQLTVQSLVDGHMKPIGQNTQIAISFTTISFKYTPYDPQA